MCLGVTAMILLGRVSPSPRLELPPYMDSTIRRIADLVADDPSLASDLLRWAERSRVLGSDGVFVAYRQAEVSTEEATTDFILRRTGGENRPSNTLYHADNLQVLRTLVDAGEHARCVYIDPPYGTSQQFARKVTDHAAYCDAATGAAYLGMIRARLLLIREVLADDGSLFVHLDCSMVGEVKIMLDELFGPSNFRGWITRRKCSSKNYTRRGFGNITDFVLFYSRSASYVWKRQYEQRSAEQEAIDFPKIDEETGRRFALVPLHAPGRRNGASGSAWRDMQPPSGKHWQWTPDRLEEFDRRGDIYWTRNGTPRRKIWADESPGSAVSNLWLDFRDPFNQNFAVTGYPTEKNLAMLRRIISAASDPGDLVLDCFAGSGTTLVAAAEMGRRWIGVDKGELAVSLSQKRLFERMLEAGLPPGCDGFDFYGVRTDPAPVGESQVRDIEFGLLEELDLEGGVGTVLDVLDETRVASEMAKLRWGERVTVFDHGGRELSYEADRSIQSAVNLPA
jgi:adenine-specific DNA-methyltransferase